MENKKTAWLGLMIKNKFDESMKKLSLKNLKSSLKWLPRKFEIKRFIDRKFDDKTTR